MLELSIIFEVVLAFAYVAAIFHFGILPDFA